MSRIAGCFNQLARSGRTALIPYLVAGDPSPESSVVLMHRLVEEGADIIELGVPFSDPMAEGPVIQLAHERALANGVSLHQVLEMVGEFRDKDQQTPVLLMGYANPLEHMGYTVFADKAAGAGVDALITVDLPPEEAAGLNTELQRVGIDNIFLIAPTTPAQRIPLITASASGFIYCISLKGVTGAGNLNTNDLGGRVEQIRAHTELPIAVGFGIKDATTAAAVGRTASGVVVGSALVQNVADAWAKGGDLDTALEAAGKLVADIRQGIDKPIS